jgi:FkbM family methyltransferase
MEKKSFVQKIKYAILRTIWPVGGIATILRGYLKGQKIIISNNSGWSPIIGGWEPEGQYVFGKVIEPGNTVFDLGANNGLHSMLFAKLTGSSGSVIAFEPLPSNIEEIRRNCSLNNITNIQVVDAAVGNTDGELSFHLGDHNKQGSLVLSGEKPNPSITVRSVRLDSFIAAGNKKPDFIKIDIEGAESDALLGMAVSLPEIKPILFIELHNPEQDGKVGQFLMSNNYRAFRVKKQGSSYAHPVRVEEIEDLGRTHPDPKGIWGTVLAVHSSDVAEIIKKIN